MNRFGMRIIALLATATLLPSTGCVVQEGDAELHVIGTQPAASPDGRYAACIAIRRADAEKRLYLESPGLLSGYTGRPYRLLADTRREVFSLAWIDLDAPEAVHRLDPPELPVANPSQMSRVRDMQFSPENKRLALLEARRLSVIDLRSGEFATWRGSHLARCVWIDENKLAVLSVEDSPKAAAGECLAVTHHIDRIGDELRGREVAWRLIEAHVDLNHTASLIDALWTPEGLPTTIDWRYKLDKPEPESPAIAEEIEERLKSALAQ